MCCQIGKCILYARLDELKTGWQAGIKWQVLQSTQSSPRHYHYITRSLVTRSLSRYVATGTVSLIVHRLCWQARTRACVAPHSGRARRLGNLSNRQLRSAVRMSADERMAVRAGGTRWYIPDGASHCARASSSPSELFSPSIRAARQWDSSASSRQNMWLNEPAQNVTFATRSEQVRERTSALHELSTVEGCQPIC